MSGSLHFERTIMTSTCMVNCTIGVYGSHTMLTLLNVVFTVKERSYEMTFGSRYQEGEEGLQDNVGVDNAVGEGCTYVIGRLVLNGRS